MTKLVIGGVDVTKDFKVDDTLGTVKLPTPVAAGGEVDVDVEFTTKMPKVFARTGYKDDFIEVGQWFPKVGVWDCAAGPHGHPATCRWRAHQHHLNSEFFADYGVYDVDVEVPKDWTVGATGVQTSEKSERRAQDARLPRRGRARLRVDRCRRSSRSPRTNSPTPPAACAS